MRTISMKELDQSPQLYQEIAANLAEDGIVCFPTSSSYRLAASMMSEKAVIRFLQIKRRTNKAPVLIFVPNQRALTEVVSEVPQGARRLMEVFWPGPLTLQFDLNPNLPRKVVRNLNDDGKVGVRIPQDPVAYEIVRHFQGPILVSSANLSRKKGACSEAQIRKNFCNWIDIFISKGDLKGEGASTVLDVTRDPPLIKRHGIVDSEEVLRVWAAEFPPDFAA